MYALYIGFRAEGLICFQCFLNYGFGFFGFKVSLGLRIEGFTWVPDAWQLDIAMVELCWQLVGDQILGDPTTFKHVGRCMLL